MRQITLCLYIRRHFLYLRAKLCKLIFNIGPPASKAPQGSPPASKTQPGEIHSRAMLSQVPPKARLRAMLSKAAHLRAKLSQVKSTCEQCSAKWNPGPACEQCSARRPTCEQSSARRPICEQIYRTCWGTQGHSIDTPETQQNN